QYDDENGALAFEEELEKLYGVSEEMIKNGHPMQHRAQCHLAFLMSHYPKRYGVGEVLTYVDLIELKDDAGRIKDLSPLYAMKTSRTFDLQSNDNTGQGDGLSYSQFSHLERLVAGKYYGWKVVPNVDAYPPLV